VYDVGIRVRAGRHTDQTDTPTRNCIGLLALSVRIFVEVPIEHRYLIFIMFYSQYTRYICTRAEYIPVNTAVLVLSSRE